FESIFEDREFPVSLFNHEAHLRLAYLHLKKYGRKEAINNVCNQLKSYVQKLGAEEKFNVTLTIAAIRAVEHFMDKSGSDNFDGFIAENPRLNSNFKELMAMHYGFDIYISTEAKEKFLEPDLLPFDD
ncbi:MAG: hypothetical protein R2784_18620, partial [Saprospiraceae bacterium]